MMKPFLILSAAHRLKYGNDSEGNLCGVFNGDGGRDFTKAPYQYIFNPLDLTTYRKCVSECPIEYGQVICSYDVAVPVSGGKNFSSYTEWISFYDSYGGNCTLTLKTKPMMNRCVPDVSSILDKLGISDSDNSTTSLKYSSATQVGTQIFSDVYDSWDKILS